MEWVLGGVCLLFVGALIHQQDSYVKLIRELTDKLMARDLRDYEQSKNPPPPRVIKVTEPPLEDFDRITG
jgi:hypothetical protein